MRTSTEGGKPGALCRSGCECALCLIFQAESLLGLKELLIHAHPKELIPLLLADVLELRLQPQSAVRRELPEIIDGASKASLQQWISFGRDRDLQIVLGEHSSAAFCNSHRYAR